MRTQTLSKFVALCSMALAMSLTTSRAQISATWIGPSGGEWNTPANWDTGVPAEGTNALVGSGTNVNYNLTMAATTFGFLTNNGTVSVNTSGFNCVAVNMVKPGGGNKFIVNSGGAATVAGNFQATSNSLIIVSNLATLTVQGTLSIGGVSNTAGAIGTMTNYGGTITAGNVAINGNNSSSSSLFVIMGGVNNFGRVTINRGPSAADNPGVDGLAIYNGIVTMTNLLVGSRSANSFLTMLVANGAVTNTGPTTVSLSSTANRPARFLQTGGWFVDAAPNVVTFSPSNAATAITVYSVTGGTNIVGGFQFGDLANIGTANFTNASTVYVDAQGINSNGAVTVNASLNGGGLFGATAPWTGNVPMKLAGGMFTFQTADMNGNPNNITISNVLSGPGGFNVTGSGQLILDATNTYAGNTAINTGTLAVGGTGAILNSLFIFVNGGALLDVSQNSGYFINPGQALAGFGSVAGAVNVSSNGVVFPGSNLITGTLTFSGSLNEAGGAINQFQLSSNPSGPNNDLLRVSGGLNASGVNYILVNGSAQIGGIYPLINYSGGGFSGSLANFAVSVNGASGILSNSASAQIIYFIPQAIIRGNTNITWVGSVANNNWDVETTSNWVDGNSANKDYFVPGDNVLFGNLEATNVINVAGSVLPASVTVSTTTNYTFTGGGNIFGTGGLTVSNGTVNMLLTNSYTGPTVLDGGVLSIPGIANGGSPSPIGSALPGEANIVLNGGTLAYTGPTTNTDRGMTLTNGGGVLDITGGTVLTLNGDITGPGPLTLQDSGNVIMASINTYTNSTTIDGTMLQLNNANGAGAGPINFSNAALVYNPSSGIDVPNAFNFVAGTTNLIAVRSGSGGNPISEGKWTGSGDVVISNSFIYTVNGNLDGMTGTIHLATPGSALFRFNSGGGNSCLGSTNATFDLGTNSAQLTDRNGGVMSLGGLAGGSSNTIIIAQDAGSGVTTWSIGGNNHNSFYSGIIENDPAAANRISALAKVGTGTLTLQGGITTVLVGLFPVTLATNLLQYTGNTTISNGTLALIVPDALTLSSNVTLAASTAVFDASQMGFVDDTGTNLITNGVFEVVSGQTLNGIGTIRGTVITDPGSTFNVGLPGSTGTMTVTNAVSLGGTTRLKVSDTGSPASDELISQSSITNGGDLVVTNIGGTLQGGDTFTLFHASSYIGTFNSVTLPTLAGSQSWDTSKLYTQGKISVVGSAAPMSFSGIHASGNDIVLNAVGGTPNGPVSVLTSTNLLIPVNLWSTLISSNFDNGGNFTLTVTGALTSGRPQQFYLLHVP
jgi:autotransporter-associated beta strand protein